MEFVVHIGTSFMKPFDYQRAPLGKVLCFVQSTCLLKGWRKGMHDKIMNGHCWDQSRPPFLPHIIELSHWTHWFVPDDFIMQQLIFRTQQHLNSYARQGLRVLVMARRTLSDVEYNDWLRKHGEATLMIENRERRLRESYSRLETNLTLLGEYVKQV